MTKEQFKKLCKRAWSKPHNFVVIDLTSQKHSGKYRSGFDDFYIIEYMNTEILEKIERSTSPKTSTQIVVSDNSTKIKTTFDPPLELDRTRKYEIALVNLETYYSFPNIHSGNNVFRYSPGFVEVGSGDEDGPRQRQWAEIQIDEGSYDLVCIAETIKIAMKRNGHGDDSIKIRANTNTLKTVLEISNDFQVDFRMQNSISSVLGFQN